MSSNPEVILAPSAVKVRIALEPAFNALTSLLCLNLAEEYSGLGEWVVETQRAMTGDQRRKNRIVMDFCYAIVQPRRDWASFAQFLDGLKASDFVALRDAQLELLGQKAGDGGNVSPNEALKDKRFLEEWLGKTKHGDQLAPAEREELAGLLQAPDSLKDYVVSHLETMWDRYLAAEWKRVRPMLQASITAFGRVDFGGLSAEEAVRKVIGRDLRSKMDHVSEAHTLSFIPSPHVGPYVTLYSHEGVLRIAFGARLPDGVTPESASSGLGRSDLLVRLSALADDTRLQILELLKDEGALYAQDIINRLELSQSSASRHLIQLSATGFLKERRQERGKCYSLNPDCVAKTVNALERVLG